MVDRYGQDWEFEPSRVMMSDDGPYVMHSDYEALEAKLAALEKLLQAHQTRGNTTEARREDR